MELAEDAGAVLGTVCNVRGLVLLRDWPRRVMLTQAGPEIGVASTKAFTTQLVALLLLALALRRARGPGRRRSTRTLVGELQRLPMAVEQVLATDGAVYREATDARRRRLGLRSSWAAASSTRSPSKGRSSSRRSPTSTPRATRRAR